MLAAIDDHDDHGHDSGRQRHVVLRHAADQQEAEAALRRKHLADQDAKQAQRKADPQTVDDIRQAGGHQNPQHGAAGRKPQHLGRPDQHRRQITHRAEREQGHRHQSVHDAEGDLGRHAEAEDQQHDRIERNFRDGIEACQNRLGDLAGKAPARRRSGRAPARSAPRARTPAGTHPVSRRHDPRTSTCAADRTDTPASAAAAKPQRLWSSCRSPARAPASAGSARQRRRRECGAREPRLDWAVFE